MSAEKPVIDKTAHLNALRSAYKLNKKMKTEDISPLTNSKLNRKLDDMKNQLHDISGEKEEDNNNNSLQAIKDRLRGKHMKKKSTGTEVDVSVKLQAYNCVLKNAKEKQFFELRENFGRAISKFGDLDTRDIVEQ